MERSKKWRELEALQQPLWKSEEDRSKVINELKNLPSLVFSGETRNLRKEMEEVFYGKKFILQIGNCAESFEDCNGRSIHNFIRIVLQMTRIIESVSGKEVVKIGRIAGQYAKPRSEEYETIGGQKIPSYRGDIINGHNPTLKDREPDAKRMLKAYSKSAATLNLIRAFIQGGYGKIENIEDWKNHPFIQKIMSEAPGYFLEGDITKEGEKSQVPDNLYVSHECLLLDYEDSFVRMDTTNNKWYSTSAHSLWIGDRTRSPLGAHIEFVSGINNPIGIKIGPKYDLDEVVGSIKKINPLNELDKIMIICRMGREKIKEMLPPLIQTISSIRLNVIWCCDPMHGNTKLLDSYKTRYFVDIEEEIIDFFDICKINKVIPGGIHLEITSESVTECIGGKILVSPSDISRNYKSKVDPRLNAAQGVEISYLIAEKLKKYNSEENITIRH